MFSSAETVSAESASQKAPYRLVPNPALYVCESRKPRKRWAEAEQLDLLVSKVLSGDALYRRHCQRIISLQARLKLRVSRSAWVLYLYLEEAEVERLTYALDRVAAEARARGRRSRGR